MVTYQIYELSARAVMSYAAEQDGVYTFALNRSATEHCKVPGARHEQDSCAMFHQLMYQLHGKGWRERGEEKVTALSDVLFYMDFAGIFDRRGTGRTQQARREKARDMFRSRPAGRRPETCSVPRGSPWTSAAAHTAMWLLSAPPA